MPTKAQLLAAIEAHRDEVYSDARPNFCWDIELYQAAGLLPEDYEHPDEDELNGSVYQLRTALEALLRTAEPTGLALAAEGIPLATTALADAVTDAKRALANHGNAKAAPLPVVG